MNNLAEKEFNYIVLGASLLAANAGFINVVTLQGIFSVTVSHVTGTVSRIAISLYTADFATLAMVSSILISFMFGAFVSGYMVGDHKFQLGKSYGYALLLESFMLFMSFTTLKRELILGEWCAAFACGLQNAMATSYSGMVVRTTHMTGLATDIGNILGQACRSDTKAELWRLKVHVPILFSYIFGGVFGQLTYQLIKEQAFLFPCIFTGGIGAVYLSLPAVQNAAKIIKEVKLLNIGAQPAVEVRIIGDPTKINTTDIYAGLSGKNVDLDIQNFFAEIGDDAYKAEEGAAGSGTPTSIRRRAVGPLRTTSFGGADYRNISAGGSVEVLYSSTPVRQYTAETPIQQQKE
ncbi:hypothetical protein HDV05_003654 [Chytridiales sp. JEL 0842]|nr:hypothetical protein HDV05_003654 [Chytridiales sp. JEL 0842]